MEDQTQTPEFVKPLGIQGLFPKPVKISELPRDFTSEELEFISMLLLNSNKGNKISQDGFVLDSLSLQNLKKFCLAEATSFCVKILGLPNNVRPYITQSWVNLTQAGEFHHRHYHNNSYVSGVLYINALEHTDKIHFHREEHDWLEFVPSSYNIFNSSTWFFPVWTRALVLFPSSLPHSVYPVVGEHSRISLSFNVFLEGELGSYSNKTYLHLPPRLSG